MGDKLRKFKVHGSNENNKSRPRNHVAKEMIENGTGHGGPMKDRRAARANEREHQWQDEWED